MSVKKNINFKKSTMLFFLVDKRKKQTNIIINNTLERVNMDKYQELLSMRIGLDEQFEFKCKCCGKCCEHRHDITLTPVDLYKIANYYCRDITDIINPAYISFILSFKYPFRIIHAFSQDSIITSSVSSLSILNYSHL